MHHLSSSKTAAVKVASHNRRVLNIGGGGIFFWWMTGVMKSLSQNSKLAESFILRGASAGALAAVLGHCEVSCEEALHLAHKLAIELRVFERPLGLVGVWGGMLRSWLHELLPEHAAERCSGHVQVIVTEVPTFKTIAISEFHSKEDVIDVCLESCHIPLLLDGNLAARFRGQKVIDGAIFEFFKEARDITLSQLKRLVFCNSSTRNQLNHNEVHLSYRHDQELLNRGLGFFQVKSFDDVREMMDMGIAYGHKISQQLHSHSPFSETITALSTLVQRQQRSS